MYIVPHLSQMPLIQHPQYVVPHGLHHAHPTPPFHPGSVPHSPNVQPGHNQSYYNQEASDFVLYDSNGTVTSSSPIHQHSPPLGNYQLAYTMAGHSPPYTMYSPPPGMPLPQRQDSLGNYLSAVFPENNGVAAEGAIERAMPSELIAEMEENLRKQGRTDTKLSIAEKYYHQLHYPGTLLTKFKGPRSSLGRCLADHLANPMTADPVVRRGSSRSGKNEQRVRHRTWAPRRTKKVALWRASRRFSRLA